MSRALITSTLSSALLAAVTGIAVDVFTENGPQPNFATQVNPWLLFEIAIDARSQISMGQPGVRRARGALQIAVFEKVGDGTGITNDVFDALDQALSNQYLGGAVMGDAQGFKPANFDQWSPLGVQYLFTFDDID